jgi:CBS domain-containing protein
VAHGFTVLVMRRSILTEKVSRRGFHLSREYAVDPLEILFVREVMRPSVALAGDLRVDQIATSLHAGGGDREQRLYPVVSAEGCLQGVATRRQLLTLARESANGGHARLGDVVTAQASVAHPDESLRVVVYRMAETGLTRFPVVERETGKLLGLLCLNDLLKARALNLEAEQRRERMRPLHLFFPRYREERL